MVHMNFRIMSAQIAYEPILGHRILISCDLFFMEQKYKGFIYWLLIYDGLIVIHGMYTVINILGTSGYLHLFWVMKIIN